MKNILCDHVKRTHIMALNVLSHHQRENLAAHPRIYRTFKLQNVYSFYVYIQWSIFLKSKFFHVNCVRWLEHHWYRSHIVSSFINLSPNFHRRPLQRWPLSTTLICYFLTLVCLWQRPFL